MEARILLVEDNAEVAEMVTMFLQRDGMFVQWIADGSRALEIARTSAWDLLLLDIMLPGMDGYEICRQLRSDRVNQPIVFLTARDDTMSKNRAAWLDADDYLVKPFSGDELVDHVKLRIRRFRAVSASKTSTPSSHLRLVDRMVDLSSGTIWRDGKEQPPLSAKECELLRFFVTNAGQVFTTEQLFRGVWGEKYFENDDNTVAVHISRVRKKIEPDPDSPRYIVTARGLGYRFVKGAQAHSP